MKPERPFNSSWGLLPLIVYVVCDLMVNYKIAMLGALFTTLTLYLIVIVSSKDPGYIIGLVVSTLALPLFIFHFYILPEDIATFYIPISGEVLLLLILGFMFWHRRMLYHLTFKWFHEPVARRIARNLQEFNRMSAIYLLVFSLHLSFLLICYLIVGSHLIDKPFLRMSGFLLMFTLLILREIECVRIRKNSPSLIA